MSAEHTQPLEGTVVQAADRFVKQPPIEPPQAAISLGQEHGAEVEKVAEKAPRRTAGEVTLEAAVLTGTGLAHIAQTAWHYQQGGEFTDRIQIAKRQLTATSDPAERRVLNEEIEHLREARKAVRHARHREPVTIAGAISAVVYPAGIVIGTLAVGPLVLTGVLPIPLVLYVAGRKARKQRELPEVVAGEVVELTANFIERAPDGPIGDQRILAALRDIRLVGDAQTIRPIGVPTPDMYGNTTIEFSLPSGITCDLLKKKAKAFAGALGLSLDRIDIEQGEAEGDVRLWIAARTPFSGNAPTSPLVTAERWSIWDGTPFGTTRKCARKDLQLLWSSMLFGGAQGYGKTTAMRLPAAAGVLDPHCRMLFADFKGGADWEDLEQVAHTAIIGADPDAVDAFLALVDELIDEMDSRFARIRAMPKARRPEMKLTPEIAREDDMPVLLFLIDEIQEAFGALLARTGDQKLGIPSGRQQFTQTVEKLARLIRRGRACGLIVIAAGQRPDATSVPTAFRDVILKRYSVHTVDDTSSDMILGDGAASRGLTAANLGRIGVGVLAEEAGGEKIQPDWITPQQFEQICARGRQLRIEAGTLTGHAAHGQHGSTEGRTPRRTVRDAIAVMDTASLDRMPTGVLTDSLRHHDSALYGDLTEDSLRALMHEAGVGAPVPIGAWEKKSNARGYKREALAAAL